MTSDTGMKGGATVDSDTINLLTTNPVTSVDNAIDSAAGIAFKAITDGANVVNDTMVVAEKTVNLVTGGHYATNAQLIYYNSIDEYNNLKATGGVITSQQELMYIGLRELIGEPLTNEELKEAVVSYLQKRGDEYAVEGATKGYFKDYNNILMFDYYLDLKLELINIGIDFIPLTESDKINLSRTLKQGSGEALSIQLQKGYGMTPWQADKTSKTSCLSASLYWELKLRGAVKTYSDFYRVNVDNGNIKEINGEMKRSTADIAKDYGYDRKTIANYNDYISGTGGENGVTRIHVNATKPYEHSIPTYLNSEDEPRKIADVGVRGYGKTVKDSIYKRGSSDSNRKKEYFKNYQYLEKVGDK